MGAAPPITESTPHRPWPAGRARAVRQRRRVRPSAPAVPVTPLFVVALAILAWRLPFYDPRAHPSDGFALDVPAVTSAHDLELAPRVTLDRRAVVLDGRHVARTDDVVAHVSGALGRLADDLEALRRNWAILRPREPHPGSLQLRVDRETPWHVVRAVTLVAATHHHPHIAFVVRAARPEPPFEWSRFAE